MIMYTNNLVSDLSHPAGVLDRGTLDGLGFVMKERIARPSIVAMALLMPGSKSPQALRSRRPRRSRRRPRTRRRAQHRAALPASTSAQAINPAARKGGQPIPPSLPSAVSPDIERFVRQIGRDLPPSSAPRPIGPVTRAAGQPTPPSLPSTVSPDIERFVGRIGRDPHSPSPSVASPIGLTARSSGPAATPPSPLATTLRLKAAPFDPNDVRFPINLATALRLSDARPLIVAAAQARVLGRRGRVDAGQGPLDSRPQRCLRLPSPRWRRPGLQQGHHDRAEHELLLRRWRPVGGHLHDRCHLPAPGGSAGPELAAMGHPIREERRTAPDRRRLLHGPPVPGNVRQLALHG